MKIQKYLICAMLVTLAGRAQAAGGPDILKQGPQPLKATEHRVGRRIGDISFTDLEGRSGKLSDYQTYDALVIAMNVVDCPICRKFSTAFNAIEAQYEPLRVAFLMVNGNDQATSDELKSKTAQLGFKARYLPDLDHSVAGALDAQTSSEVFILDSARTLVYRGPVSDQYGLGYSLAQPRNEYLKDALKAALNHEVVKSPALTAPGCTLGLTASAKSEPPITFNNRISRIVQYNCQSCHRSGESAPFPLVTYRDVKGHASMIRFVVQQKQMPPWFASPSHGTWSNDGSLTQEDRRALLSWLTGNMAEGDASDAPLARKWPQGLEIGKPELSYSVPKPISVPTDGVIPYQYVIVNSGLTQDVWVTATEIVSPHPELLHHVLVFVRAPENIATGPRDGTAATDEMLGAQVPGAKAHIFSSGLGHRIPKGSQLVFQIHVTPNGVAGEVQPRLALRTTSKPLTEVKGFNVINTTFVIPPGESNYRVEASRVLKKKTRLISFTPHMHLRGKAFRYELFFPDATHRIALDVPKYDFNWQLPYISASPIDVPAGTTIKATAWYDNSADNPANPDPSVSVHWGEQTTDEMMLGFVDGYELP